VYRPTVALASAAAAAAASGSPEFGDQLLGAIASPTSQPAPSLSHCLAINSHNSFFLSACNFVLCAAFTHYPLKYTVSMAEPGRKYRGKELSKNCVTLNFTMIFVITA